MNSANIDPSDTKNRLGAAIRKLNVVVIVLAICAIWLFTGAPHKLWPKSKNTQTQDLTSEDEESDTIYSFPYEKDEDTGLVLDRHVEVVKRQCTSCHSAVIIQNTKATQQGWLDLIHWMQETQGLWDLRDDEGPILEYLVKHYGVQTTGSSVVPEADAWYEID
jgi:hypothetical protein